MEKIIYLKRATPFKHEAMHSDVMQSQLALTHRSIGNYFVSSTNPKLGTGLTPLEEALLVPLLLGISPTSAVEYAEGKKKYYTDIVTKIPGGNKGLPLNIGLMDNTKKLGEMIEYGGQQVPNLPDNVEDFCRYRHALSFPFTAASTELAKGDQTAWYYIEDPSIVLNTRFSEIEIKDKAYTEYLKIKDDPKAVTMLVSVCKTYIRKQPGKPPINVANLGDKERIMVLQDIVSNRPEKFYELATDVNLKKRYLIEELYAVGLLGRISNTFVDKEDSNAGLGETVGEVIVNLWNNKETSRLNRLKARYDEIKKGTKVLA